MRPSTPVRGATRHRHRGRVLMAALAVLVAFLVRGVLVEDASGREATTASPAAAAEPASPAPTSTTPAPPTAAAGVTPAVRPFQFSLTTVDLDDLSRDTPARGAVPARAGRDLPTWVLRPQRDGLLPVVVFAHGYNTEPGDYLALLATWAQAGYLVVAPTFPGSTSAAAGTPTEGDIDEQARDVSFIIDQVLAGVFGAADQSRIAVAGHSDGGSTVVTLALNRAFTDTRIASYLALSGDIPSQVAEGTWGTGSGPGAVLVAVGADDEYGNLPAAGDIYRRTSLPAALVIVPGGDHLGIYVADDPTATELRQLTVDFLDRTLTGSATTGPDLDGFGDGSGFTIDVHPAD